MKLFALNATLNLPKKKKQPGVARKGANFWLALIAFLCSNQYFKKEI